MARKIFTDESLATFVDEIRAYTDNAASKKANTSHNHAASNITSGTLSTDRLPTIPIAKGGTGATTAANALVNLGITATASELNKLDGITATTTELNYIDGVTSNIQTQIDAKVPTSRTINGKALSSNISLSASDVGASASGHTHSYLPLSGGNLTGNLGIGNRYELGSAYNYTNGYLIDIGAAKSSTMVAIHITGNSYNASTPPIDSLFQFYDYGDGTIMNYSGINLGLSLGAMTVYRYNNRLYAHIKQAGSYQTYNFTIITNKSGLNPTVTNTAAHTSGYTDLITITPQNISLDGHTHKYAGSSSAGGAANSAVKATQDASGNVITSTYATKTELNTAKEALQSSINGKANSSHTHSIANINSLQTTLDGKQATITGGASTIASSNLTANRALISNGSGKVAVSEVTSTELGYLDGVTSNLQTQINGKSSTSHTHNYAGSSSAGGSATSAVKLDTATAGDANTPVYFTGGKPVACTSLDLNTSGSSASCTGNSATATKLQTARTIGIGTGATGTATSFNGTGNITIPITDVKETYLSWGGKNLAGSVSPIDAASSNIHSANRFTFAKPAGITIEYSTNGSTYSTYSTTDSAKINLVSGIGSSYYIGARSTSTTVNDKLRITLNATNMGLYTRLRKLLINISTNYATGSNVIIEKAMKGSETTFTTIGTYNISGWSGWNSIPINAAFGGGSNQTGNIAVLRLTFGITGVNSEQTSNALQIQDIIGIGDTYWSYPSTMAKTGHIYTYDSSQNATFHAAVSAPTFSGSGVATVAEVKSYLGID